MAGFRLLFFLRACVLLPGNRSVSAVVALVQVSRLAAVRARARPPGQVPRPGAGRRRRLRGRDLRRGRRVHRVQLVHPPRVALLVRGLLAGGLPDGHGGLAQPGLRRRVGVVQDVAVEGELRLQSLQVVATVERLGGLVIRYA